MKVHYGKNLKANKESGRSENYKHKQLLTGITAAGQSMERDLPHLPAVVELGYMLFAL